MERGNVRNLVLAFPDGAPVGVAADGADAPPGAGEKPGTEAAGAPDERAAGGGIGAMPRDDVLQYIGEMCDALAYMARSQQCAALARLLDEAAAEAERVSALA